MNESFENQDSWEACPRGELTGMVQQLGRQRRGRTLVRIGGGAAGALVLLIAIGSLWYFQGPTGQNNYAGITCDQVKQLMPQYRQRTISAAKIAQIDEHLRHCAACQESMKRMSQPPTAQQPPRQHSHEVACGCSHCSGGRPVVLASYWPRR